MATANGSNWPCFFPFLEQPDPTDLPERFTFPFHYDPHPLCLKAVKELQAHLSDEEARLAAFGPPADDSSDGRGKMFGVLVVAAPDGTIGYLRAFSGKLGEDYLVKGFVPPVYNLDAPDGFFRKGEAAIDVINRRVAELERAPDYLTAREVYTQLLLKQEEERLALKRELRANKRNRDEKRKALDGHSPKMVKEVLLQLAEESKRDHFREKDQKKAWRIAREKALAKLKGFEEEIKELRRKRKQRSANLQDQLFAEYIFLNQNGQAKGLGEIFLQTTLRTPPAGAGECAAPKLLQYAFRAELRPLALAEFWWGSSPTTVVRHHGSFYPACRGKCEPILGHMLGGILIDPDPFRRNPAAGKSLEFLYEDEQIIVVNKPAEFLSVPGRHIEDSVWLRIKAHCPDASGPLIVHRLDMSTSGLMVIAKTMASYLHLQRQFAERKVRKRYVALLGGLTAQTEGLVELPLLPDYNERPRQRVCHVKGKAAKTRWELIGREDGFTRVYFYPETGRTHQLRVHAAHIDGLGIPIRGDDLYGQSEDRLYLHAEQLRFTHPETEKEVVMHCNCPF